MHRTQLLDCCAGKSACGTKLRRAARLRNLNFSRSQALKRLCPSEPAQTVGTAEGLADATNTAAACVVRAVPLEDLGWASWWRWLRSTRSAVLGGVNQFDAQTPLQLRRGYARGGFHPLACPLSQWRPLRRCCEGEVGGIRTALLPMLAAQTPPAPTRTLN